MKAVIYARTATTQHAEHGNSIPAQVEACRKYAKENGFDVTEVFADAGYSGARLDRPALRKMRSLIARDSISAVVVSDLARLTRSVTDKFVLEREFAKRGTQVQCVKHGADDSTVSAIRARGRKRTTRG
jgi:site-specific DNA recombinase